MSSRSRLGDESRNKRSPSSGRRLAVPTTLGGHAISRFLTALALALLATAAASPARGEEIVREIEFLGLQTLSEETLRFYLGLELGAPLDAAALAQRVHELWNRQLIDDVRIEKLPAIGGIKLSITILERPMLRSLDFRGLEGLSRSDVEERMAREQISLREGEPLNLGEVARLEALLEATYREKGFLFAEATHAIEEVSPTERRVVFTIDEAEKVRIGAIRFDGNSAFHARRLRWVMKKTKKSGMLTRALKRDSYNAIAIQEDLLRIRNLYREKGYKNASIGEPSLEVLSGRRNRRLAVTVPIDEGARWKLGSVRVEGGSLFKQETLLAQFHPSRGSWLHAGLISKGVDQIRDMYRNFGHIMSDVTSELEEREDNVADLVIKITEGDQYRVGRIEFEGNSRTRDNVLRREFRVQEGMLLNMGGVKNSIYKINQLQYFKLDEDDPVAFENFDSERKTVDLRIVGEEADRVELQVGGGWSESYGLFGQVSAKTPNLFGRGQTLGASIQYGVYTSQYDLTYSVPWLFERPQSIGAQVYSSVVDYTQYLDYESRQESTGFALSYGRSLGLFQNTSLTYSAYDRFDQLSVVGADGELVPIDYDVINASLRLSHAFDSRNSRVETTRGSRLLGALEYAGGALGGNNHLIRAELGASHFLPVSKLPVESLFAVNVKGGWVQPTGGRELLPLERFFLGGENSVRGFGFRDLTVRCLGGEDYPGRTRSKCRPNERLIDDSYALLGGDKFVQLNLEYHVLLGGPFRILGFVDAGNVYADSQSVDLSRLRRSAGLELRIFVPMFGAPLRFIYATNLAPIDDDEFETFQFSIGATF